MSLHKRYFVAFLENVLWRLFPADSSPFTFSQLVPYTLFYFSLQKAMKCSRDWLTTEETVTKLRASDLKSEDFYLN